MTEKDRTPEIRFAGFTDEWERRKLGDEVADIIGGGTPSTLNPAYWAGDIDWYSPTEIGEKVYANGSEKKITELGLQKSSAKVLPAGKTVLFTSRAGIGDMAILHRSGSTNQGFQSLVLKEGYDTYFIYSMGHLIKRYAEKHSSGSTFLEISGKMLGKMEIQAPSADEQTQIGTFFQHVDTLITRQQRKYDKLGIVKESMLEKMFPKDGADIPEIRFDGFTDAWERRKLGEYFAERNQRSSDGELISITMNSGVVKASDLDRHDNSSNDKSNYKIVEVGDIAYNSMRMWQGASGYSSYSGILSPAYTVVTPVEGVYSLFFAYMFKKPEMKHIFTINSQGLTSDTWNLKFPSFSTIETKAPKYEEQKKIADFFTHLESLITLQQRKLEKLKNIKKALLEKMFV